MGRHIRTYRRAGTPALALALACLSPLAPARADDAALAWTAVTQVTPPASNSYTGAMAATPDDITVPRA